MTPKSLISADFTELRNIEVRCACGMVLSLPAHEEEIVNQLSCPSCKVQLWGDQENPAYNHVRDLLHALCIWNARAGTGKPRFTLGFTLEAPHA